MSLQQRRASFARAFALVAFGAGLGHSGRARADESATVGSRVHAYAVVVGDNLGGSGQQALRFAEDDARNVAQVLREIGHYDAGDVRVLLQPDAAHLFAAIDEVTMMRPPPVFFMCRAACLTVV